MSTEYRPEWAKGLVSVQIEINVGSFTYHSIEYIHPSDVKEEHTVVNCAENIRVMKEYQEQYYNK